MAVGGSLRGAMARRQDREGRGRPALNGVGGWRCRGRVLALEGGRAGGGSGQEEAPAAGEGKAWRRTAARETWRRRETREGPWPEGEAEGIEREEGSGAGAASWRWLCVAAVHRGTRGDEGDSIWLGLTVRRLGLWNGP